MKNQTNATDVIIFGAGPSGLAGAHELVTHNKKIIIFEKDKQVGGISKTIKFRDCYFDLGGHRFFTKSQRVNKLWNKTLGDNFLKRPRLSRIYYRNKFFNYPIKPLNAFKGLGLITSIQILFSYLLIKLFPYKRENTFEEWTSNRFGKKLYRIFFKTYTEKLWGIPCTEIQAEWVAQRIKGLSLLSAVKNALLPNKNSKIKTLINEFKYPKYGPGMMYSKMAEDIKQMGGKIYTETEVLKINHTDFTVNSATVKNKAEQITEETFHAKNFLSSMPITTLIKRLSPSAPEEVIQASNNLTYRSFISISVILKAPNPFPDTWIYIHSPEVKMGRIQNFKNWSPHMVANDKQVALGLEYFCTENDELWNMKDEDLIKLGLEELEKIHLGKKETFVDGFVARVPKAYPVYDRTYNKNLEVVKNYLDKFKNLQPIGRYGMFKYNNMDHSILTGIYAAENILGKEHNIWQVNADQEYHEQTKK